MGMYFEKDKIVEVVKEIVKYGGDIGIEVANNPFQIKVWFLDYSNKICGFTLVEQKNCCGILVSTRTFVTESYKGKGFAQLMMPIKEDLAKAFNYNLLLATVNMTGNPAEVHILEKFGWELKDSFINKKTKNQVGIFTKNLEE